ncbi:MAG: GNAT family N-acetyltransferase [Actinomycetia bacterium]|nr:GNAT family N-acetyltransferase [Actinomycetes bacterium]
MTVVTDLTTDTGRPLPVNESVAAAEAAATVAGVTIRQLDGMEELHAVCDLYEQIWRFGTKGAPVTSELLRAMSKAGSYVAGAFDGAQMIGACVGFFAPPAQEAMHSHIAGVSTRARGRSVGFALKVHQRAWALVHGVTEISWTFDPLVGRNAYFNLAKLGARPVEYLANFYGPMHDDLNGNDETDRLLVSWQLDDPRVVRACAGELRSEERTPGAAIALEAGESGEPVVHAIDTGSTALVAVPRDIEAMRASAPDCAARWRTAVRDVLGGLLTDGARIYGFDRDDRYIVDTGGNR